eukprot:4334657-Pleurochrysis_carterae.AAC.1
MRSSPDGQTDQPGPSQPYGIEHDPAMPADVAVEQNDTHLEDAPAVRPKVLFGESDPAVRARLWRPTQFTDPLSPPPSRPPPLRRLPSPVQPCRVRQRKMPPEPASCSRITRSQSRARAAAGLPPATVQQLPATSAQNPVSAGKATGATW